MKYLYKKALEAHNSMLELHIDTKTSDALFHKSSESFYETLFEVAHQLWEKNVDLGWKLTELTLQEKKNKANKIIKDFREELENYKENNEISLWTEDLLWSLANDLENIEWDSKWFVK